MGLGLLPLPPPTVGGEGGVGAPRGAPPCGGGGGGGGFVGGGGPDGHLAVSWAARWGCLGGLGGWSSRGVGGAFWGNFFLII